MIRRVFTLVLLCTFCTPLAAGTLSVVSYDRWVTVAKVLDGDTFTTPEGERIRLLGINAPEIMHEESAAQPFGDEAADALRQLLHGQQVRLHFDREKKDIYGRTLAHVYLRDGTWLNAELVRRGLAHVYTFVPNISAAEALLRIEQQAISAGRNMWQHERWQVLAPEALDKELLGSFRLVQGEVSPSARKPWQFALGKLHITVPLKYRRGFKAWKQPKPGETVLVRGQLRMSSKGDWFLSIHTPADMLVVSDKIKRR